MAGALIAKVITVGAAYAPLSAATCIAGNVKVTSLTGNGATVYIKGDDGASHVPLAAGEWVLLKGVDLALVEVKGAASDKVTVVGSTWL